MSNPQSAIRDPQSQDGVLVIDKPEGLTSHDVVARVRRILKTRRVGHTGTLDPFATGVLVVCVNRATRLVQFLAGDEKEYFATMRLGFSTDTGDFTGIPKTPVTDARNITSEIIQGTFSHFLGHIKQVPPMYSAKKVGGVKLYELARRGEEIERAPVEVEIKKLELFKQTGDSTSGSAQASAQNQSGEFSFRVVCSSGTYIRALGEEIGRLLDVGAHLTGLRRIRAGSCSLDSAVTLEELADLAQSGQTDRVIISMADAIAMPTLQVGEEERKRISHGRSIEHPEKKQADYGVGALVKVCDKKNQLIAIAQLDEGKILWRPKVVLID
ncbi:MAG TPA: tRNA pseudouridine(55) synthase TruB [Blastocatellia bacterium]|nr:tRNA pseudouridine(55) synthase TruB [Blastocatellia bacterium]